jgi:hypothetical protein
MTTDRILDRVRAANSAPTVTIDNQELFARIVASPGDPRLGEAKRRDRRFAFRGHPLAVFGACAALAACGTAGAAKLGLIPDMGVFAHDTARHPDAAVQGQSRRARSAWLPPGRQPPDCAPRRQRDRARPGDLRVLDRVEPEGLAVQRDPRA